MHQVQFGVEVLGDRYGICACNSEEVGKERVDKGETRGRRGSNI